MRPAALLSKLQPLLASGANTNLEPIRELFRVVGREAEVEVARLWLLSSSLGDELFERAHSRDPRERLTALTIAAELFPAGARINLLRRMVRDPDPQVRRRARKLMFDARCADVALPDARFLEPTAGDTERWPYRLGGYNASGWSAGLYRDARMNSRHGVRQRLRRPLTRKAPREETAQLPKIPDVDALVELLEIEGDLARFCRPGAGPGSGYVEFDVPKARGGTRRLAAPRAALKRVQRRILREILSQLPVHPACHAYATGRSLVTNAAPHARAALVVKTDLRDFFPSVHFHRVCGLYYYYRYDWPVAAALAKLTTYMPRLADGSVIRPGVLPQGAPTSPAIANLICRALDARLTGLAGRVGAHYTRYADDLTFSFAEPPRLKLGQLFWWIDQICGQEGFEEHIRKRQVLRPHQRQLVTGVVVNEGATVPRAARRRFRALLHRLQTTGKDENGRSAAALRQYMFGFAAYVKMVQPELGARLMADVRQLYHR